MQIRVRTEAPVKVLTLGSNDWRLDNGQTGTTYKAGILCDGDIDKVKVSPDLYRELKTNTDYVLSGVLSVTNGNSKFVFDSIVRSEREAGKPVK